MQFSTAGLGWEVLDGADADGSSVAPLIGSTQTGMYTAATIWFGSIASFFYKQIFVWYFSCWPKFDDDVSINLGVSLFFSPVGFCCLKLIGCTKRKLEILSGNRPMGEEDTCSCLYTKGDNCPVRIFDICT